MANKLNALFPQGVSNVDPGAILSGYDLRDVQVGIEHGPTGTVYNRKAVPWSGGAYTLVDGNWTKIGGRPGALSGREVEAQYSNLADVWRQFAQAQRNRDDNPGGFEALVADLRRVSNSISSVGTMSESEGISYRAQKMQAERGANASALPSA